MTKVDNVEESHQEIINSAIADLKKKNKRAYDLLLETTHEGFFEQHQTKGKVNDLADKLLETITSKGG